MGLGRLVVEQYVRKEGGDSNRIITQVVEQAVEKWKATGPSSVTNTIAIGKVRASSKQNWKAVGADGIQIDDHMKKRRRSS